jgi:dienelactone hydrolase
VNGGFVPWTPLGDYDGNSGTPNTPAPCNGPPFHFEATKPDSTTNCFRIPNATTALNLPIMITVPKTAKPAGGWPVVIFQHGITGNRGQMIPLGATLAGAGFVTVAIDLPLHGISATDTFAGFRQAGNERTFDLDISNGSSCLSNPAGDGVTDPSGTCFINLGSLPTSRDNLRQAVSDLINVAKSLPALDLDGGGADVDATKLYFAGISLGSIVGTTFLAVNTDVKAAALSVPGGGVARLLDASKSFGPIVAAGLSGAAFSGAGLSGTNAPFEGTDTYETFIRFAQHLVDPGDPINYATVANANHNILMHEVVGDTVVPNSALTTCPAASSLPLGIGATATDNTLASTRLAACLAGGELVGSNSVTKAACYAGVDKVGLCAGSATQDATLISGFLSGTEPLFGQMGLDVVGPIDPTASSGTTCANQTDVGGLHQVVQFGAGTHGSLLTPAGPGGATQFLAVTVEMQREFAYFLGSGGLTVAGGSCP